MEGSQAQIKKLDYLLDLDINQLQMLADIFSSSTRAQYRSNLMEVKIILETSRASLNPEEQKVYDKFIDRKKDIDDLVAQMKEKPVMPTTASALHAIPHKEWETPSISLVPLSGGTVWVENPNFDVGIDVKAQFGEFAENADPTVSRGAVIQYAKAYAMSMNPHLSQSTLKSAAKDLGNYLNDNMAQTSASDPTMRGIIDRLMKGDTSAINELSNTAFGEGLKRAAAESKLVVYDGTALTRYRAGTLFRVTNPKGTEEFDAFTEGVGKSPGFVFLNWFLGLEYAMLEVGTNKFKLDDKTQQVKVERGSETGHKLTAKTGVQLGTTDPLTWLGVWDQPMIIEVSAEIGWVRSGTTQTKDQFYLGVQSIDFQFPGKEAERWPVRLVGAGVKHVGTDFRENYLGYAVLNVPLRRAGSVDFDINISPYVNNFFGLLYGGAEAEVMATMFHLSKEKDKYVGIGVGADIWSGVNSFGQRETGIDPYLKASLNLKWLKVGLRGGYKGLMDKKYGQGGFDLTFDVGFEF